MLDSGSMTNFDADKNSRDYGLPISRQKWVQFEVNNAEFVRAQPMCGI